MYSPVLCVLKKSKKIQWFNEEVMTISIIKYRYTIYSCRNVTKLKPKNNYTILNVYWCVNLFNEICIESGINVISSIYVSCVILFKIALPRFDVQFKERVKQILCNEKTYDAKTLH